MLRLHVNTATADYDRTVNKGKDLLAKGKQLRVQVVLRGREKAHPEYAVELLQKVMADLEEASTVAKPPTRDNLSVTFNPKRKS